MLFQRSRGSNTMKTILRGSQWGDGFYGWQLNVWLFYGYDSPKITQSGTLEKFLRLKFLLGLTIKLYQFYAYSLIFFSRFNPIKTPLTDSTSKAQNNRRVTCMKDSYLYGQSKQFIFIEYTLFLLFLSIFFRIHFSTRLTGMTQQITSKLGSAQTSKYRWMATSIVTESEHQTVNCFCSVC